MSFEPHVETVSEPESHRDPRIFVQASVIEMLRLDENLEIAAMKYVEEGYSAKCREIMETDADVQVLLAQDRIQDAAILLTGLLERWKRSPPEQPLAA